jgi:hypothetical protein
MIHTTPQATIWAAIRSLDPTMTIELDRVNFIEEVRIGEEGVVIRLVVMTQKISGVKVAWADYLDA